MRKTLFPIKTTWGLFFVLWVSVAAFANNTGQSIFDKMYHGDVLEVTLTLDIQLLEQNRNTEEYQSATINFKNNIGTDENWTIKVRPRGKFRRRTCPMPPLKLKWKKDELEADGLVRDFNDIKLVTHCADEKWQAKEWLSKEMLAYKLYNELTPESFRVQMVRITYVDSATGAKEKNWGFLIEDKNQLAARMGGSVYKKNEYDIHALDAQAETRVTTFQYMIGNEDWNMAMVRNLVLIERNKKLIPVPYDFDFSGIVNSSYAIPNSKLGCSLITDRVLFDPMNGCIAADKYTRSLFFEKKDALFRVIKNHKVLPRIHRTTASEYVESFYQLEAIRSGEGGHFIKKDKQSNTQYKEGLGK